MGFLRVECELALEMEEVIDVKEELDGLRNKEDETDEEDVVRIRVFSDEEEGVRGAAAGMTTPDFLSPERENLGAFSSIKFKPGVSERGEETGGRAADHKLAGLVAPRSKGGGLLGGVIGLNSRWCEDAQRPPSVAVPRLVGLERFRTDSPSSGEEGGLSSPPGPTVYARLGFGRSSSTCCRSGDEMRT